MTVLFSAMLIMLQRMNSFRQGGDSCLYLPDKCNSFASMSCIDTSYPAAYLKPASLVPMFGAISNLWILRHYFRYKGVQNQTMAENIISICCCNGLNKPSGKLLIHSSLLLLNLGAQC